MADAAPGEPCDDSIGQVDEADHFKGVSVPGLAHLLELAHEPLPTHERPRLRPTFRGSRDDIGVLQLTKGIHVSRVPRFEGGSHDLHVLLRHRLLRQSHGFESGFPIQKGLHPHDHPLTKRVDPIKDEVDRYARVLCPSDGADCDKQAVALV